MLRITLASSRARNPFRLVAASRVNADFFFRFFFFHKEPFVPPQGRGRSGEGRSLRRRPPVSALRKDRQVRDRRPDPVGTSILAGIPHGGFPGRHHWGKRVTGARDLSGLFLTSR